jgi:hypothetical protein
MHPTSKYSIATWITYIFLYHDVVKFVLEYFCKWHSSAKTYALTQTAWLVCICLFLCRQLTEKLLFKLHLSLSTAIYDPFGSIFAKFLWRILLTRNCVKYFAAFSFPLFLVLSFQIISLFLFPRIGIVIFHGCQYFSTNYSTLLPNNKIQLI